ncbi:STAS domain-containing protein [Sciscionella sediminilitoris]|uniref:STAS domain-containing protein n=1 Tax=Sciscionella sediminilitoris TaxID=1445613 RepID=UPI0009E6FD50|nr:STAS domain-containing protein [Sciscionella sp. SE31]
MTPSSIGYPKSQRHHEHHGLLVCAHPRLHLYRFCPRRGVVVCPARGELDLITSPLLARELHSIDDNGSCVHTVVVDLSETTFLGASGAEVVLHAGERARANRRALAVVSRTTAVRRTLEITGADQALHWYASVSGAVDATLRSRHLSAIRDHSGPDRDQLTTPGYPATPREDPTDQASGSR